MAAGAPMKGGIGTYSYANNSQRQREEYDSAKNLIKHVLIQNLDVKSLVSSGNAFTIADLGCSIGPNTFLAMENIIDGVGEKYDIQGHNPTNLEFQVFFNDRVANDFNSLFASLPVDKRYYAAGVAGSFWGRLFPDSSICVAYSSFALQWLSKIPKELVDKESPAWNKGKIHYTGRGAKKEVVGAYAAQFEQDMDAFLNARGMEIVRGGMIVILIPGVADGVVAHSSGVALTFLESNLCDMVKEGMMKQDEMDSFNFPIVFVSVEQMSKIVEKNGRFSVLKMEVIRTPKSPEQLEAEILSFRAVGEGTVANHFGNKKTEEIFRKAIQNKSKLSSIIHSSGSVEIMSSTTQLFAILMRK